MEFERDLSLLLTEILDEGGRDTAIVDLVAGVQPPYKSLVAIKANDRGTPVNKFLISDKLLRKLVKFRFGVEV